MLIEMNGLSQDGIPTGCESVSAVMVLNYWGVDITPEEFICHVKSFTRWTGFFMVQTRKKPLPATHTAPIVSGVIQR